MNYLWYDSETSGKTHKLHHMLTVYFAIYDENLNFIDELDLQLKPNTEQECANIVCEPEAMEITGININDHLKDPKTITYAEGGVKVMEFLQKHKIKGKKRSYRPSGHNIEFDKGFLFKYLVDEEEWTKIVHYRDLDTLKVVTFLQDIGYMPADLGALGSLVEYFKLPMGKAHNAKEDVKMNVEVYRSIINMMKEKKKDTLSLQNSELYSILEF